MKTLLLSTLALLSLSAHAFEVSDFYSYEVFRSQNEHMFESADTFYQQVFEESHAAEPMLNGKGPDFFAQKTADKPIRIMIVYPSLQLSDLWSSSIRTIREELKRYSINHELVIIETLQYREIQEQASAIAAEIEKGLDYLIYTADSRNHIPVIENVILRTNTKVLLHNITTPIVSLDGNHPMIYSGFDHYEGSKMIAQYFNEIFSEHEVVHYNAILRSPGVVNDLRWNSFYLNLDPKFKLRYAASTDSSYMESLRQLNRIAIQSRNHSFKTDLYFGVATDQSLAISDYLLSEGQRPRVMVNGWGGTDAEIERIKKGTLDVTVSRYTDDSSIAMVHAIAWDIMGEVPPPVFKGRLQLITSDMSTQQIDFIRSQGFRISGSEDANRDTK